MGKMYLLNSLSKQANNLQMSGVHVCDCDCHIWREHKITRRDETGGNLGHFSQAAGSVSQLLMVAVQQETEKVKGDDQDDKMREGFSPASDRVLRRGRRGHDLSCLLLPLLSLCHIHTRTHARTHKLPFTFANYQICWLGSCSPKTVSYHWWAASFLSTAIGPRGECKGWETTITPKNPSLKLTFKLT